MVLTILEYGAVIKDPDFENLFAKRIEGKAETASFVEFT